MPRPCTTQATQSSVRFMVGQVRAILSASSSRPQPPPPQQVRWARLGARHALKISPDLLVQQEIRRSLLALREKGGRNGRVDFHKSPQPPCFSQRPPRMSVVPSLLLSDVSDSDAHRRTTPAQPPSRKVILHRPPLRRRIQGQSDQINPRTPYKGGPITCLLRSTFCVGL
jgi:hypothetical protein